MIPVALPQLSISMEEGKVLRWLVEDGAAVAAGQPVVEVETDKATVEVEAPADGTIRRVIDEGTVVPVDTTLGQIHDGEPDAGAPPPIEEPSLVPPSTPSGGASARDGRTIASPAARRLALERGIDLASVRGSGPSGRIVASDLEQLSSAEASTTASPAPGFRRDLRAAVVANITASWAAIPHIHVGGEIDARGILEARRSAVLPSGERVTVTDLLVLAVARALRDVPRVNGGSERVNLALAVATEETVVAPVLRDATELGLAAIVRERARLVSAARAGELDPHDLGGATCTLTNLGSYPVDFFAPIVSGPQVAMVATGRVAEKAVAVDGMLAVQPRVWVNVALDHRAADGEAGGRFLAALERRIGDLPTSV